MENKHCLWQLNELTVLRMFNSRPLTYQKPTEIGVKVDPQLMAIYGQASTVDEYTACLIFWMTNKKKNV